MHPWPTLRPKPSRQPARPPKRRWAVPTSMTMAKTAPRAMAAAAAIAMAVTAVATAPSAARAKSNSPTPHCKTAPPSKSCCPLQRPIWPPPTTTLRTMPHRAGAATLPTCARKRARSRPLPQPLLRCRMRCRMRFPPKPTHRLRKASPLPLQKLAPLKWRPFQSQ